MCLFMEASKHRDAERGNRVCILPLGEIELILALIPW